jgi:predicted transcriptional regulator
VKKISKKNRALKRANTTFMSKKIKQKSCFISDFEPSRKKKPEALPSTEA